MTSLFDDLEEDPALELAKAEAELAALKAVVKQEDRFAVAPDMRGWSERAIVAYQLARDEDSLQNPDWDEDVRVFFRGRITQSKEQLTQ